MIYSVLSKPLAVSTLLGWTQGFAKVFTVNSKGSRAEVRVLNLKAVRAIGKQGHGESQASDCRKVLSQHGACLPTVTIPTRAGGGANDFSKHD